MYMKKTEDFYVTITYDIEKIVQMFSMEGLEIVSYGKGAENTIRVECRKEEETGMGEALWSLERRIDVQWYSVKDDIVTIIFTLKDRFLKEKEEEYKASLEKSRQYKKEEDEKSNVQD